MKLDGKYMRLYAVTPARNIDTKNLCKQVEMALKGGITCLQLREKEADKDKLLEDALALKKLCHKYKVPLIINDNIDIAIRSGADGVHLGRNDMDIQKARQIAGDFLIIGATVHSTIEAREAINKGADYLGIGAAFPTKTKSDTHMLTMDMIKDICKAADIPKVLIGGINSENIRLLKNSKTNGIAVVSAIFSEKNIEDAARNLRMISDELFG